MKRFQDLPIQGKLTVAMVVMLGVVLVLVGTAIYTYELLAVREAGVTGLTSLAQVVVASTTPALRFEDAAAAQSDLNSLQGNPQIMAAGLYTRNGKILAQYVRATAPPGSLPGSAPGAGTKFAAGNLQLSQPILVAGETLGTIFLQYDLELHRARLKTYALTIVAVAAISLLVALLIAARVQRSIAGPVLELAQLGRTITRDQNYSLRAVRRSQDEIGALADVLNEGLTQIEERERALQQEITERKQLVVARDGLLDEVRKANVGLRHLAQRILTAQEDERRRISRELHDEAGQALTALKIWLMALHEDLPADAPALRQRLVEAARLTDDTMNHIRALAQDLRPPALDALPLDACLKGYCHEFAHRTALQVDYRGHDLPTLPEPLNICLYRVVQEALTNVAKHAQARRVEVELHHHNGLVSLAVFDDGKGFAVATAPPAGLGLLGMRERLELLGGRLDITSEPGHGTQLVVYIPTENTP